MSDEGFGPVTIITPEGSGEGMLMPDDSIRVVGEVTLTPHYPNVLRWFAEAMRGHSFDKGAYEPVISFIETVRYCYQTVPDELEAILNELRAKADANRPLGGIEQYQDEDR